MLQREGAQMLAAEKARLKIIPDLASRLIWGVRRVLPAERCKLDFIWVPVPCHAMSSARMKTILGWSAVAARIAMEPAR
jgi:hypothetical protein